MRVSIWLGVAVSGIALLAAACGGGEGSGDGTGRATGVEGIPDGAPFVDQNGLAFHPKAVTVEL
jgi:hypothetical protein